MEATISSSSSRLAAVDKDRRPAAEAAAAATCLPTVGNLTAVGLFVWRNSFLPHFDSTSYASQPTGKRTGSKSELMSLFVGQLAASLSAAAAAAAAYDCAIMMMM